jgi:TolA-binding protein
MVLGPAALSGGKRRHERCSLLGSRREIDERHAAVQDSSVSAIKAAMRWLLTTVALATMITGATAAMAQDVCIDDKAKQSLACPGGGPKELDEAQRRTGVQLHTVTPPARPAPPVTKDPKQKWEGVDDRSIRLQARQRALLAVEVQRIESLFSTSRKNAPDRLQLARRLADGYVELESAAFRDKIQAQGRRSASPPTAPAAGQAQTDANEAERVEKAARKRAIEVYTLIVQDYPTAAQLDEVLYYLAYEYEQAGDSKNARAVYFELIQKAPSSKYVPNAYLAFVWLAKNYKAEYHVVDELRGAPTMPNSGLDEKAPPVLVGGGFWHPAASGPDKSSANPPKPRRKT